MGKSILTQQQTTYQTDPIHTIPQVGWDVNRFESLIHQHGYDAFIDRALRCPCCDRNGGQALTTCKNCGGRGWFFVDRTETRVISQHMDSKKRYADWGETQHGTASITTRGIDKLGFMDKIILTQLDEFYSEVLHPFIDSQDNIIAFPLYEPLAISNIYLFVADNEKLKPLSASDYEVSGNTMSFDEGILDQVKATMDINSRELPIQIAIRYSHYPVYHVIDTNRELMKVRESKLCEYNDSLLRSMPINVLARKAHYLFNGQNQNNPVFDNSVVPGVDRTKY